MLYISQNKQNSYCRISWHILGPWSGEAENKSRDHGFCLEICVVTVFSPRPAPGPCFRRSQMIIIRWGSIRPRICSDQDRSLFWIERWLLQLWLNSTLYTGGNVSCSTWWNYRVGGFTEVSQKILVWKSGMQSWNSIWWNTPGSLKRFLQIVIEEVIYIFTISWILISVPASQTDPTVNKIENMKWKQL
jgi:hypothetical protein